MILLVEDNANDVKLTLRAFKKNNFANEIIVARDGEEALDFLFGIGAYEGRDTQRQPVIILLDLQLPKIDGLGVLRRIRENEQTKLIPVIILSTSDEQQDRVQSYQLHANSYIRKPVDFNDFIEVIKHIGLYWLVLNQPSGKDDSNG